MPLLEPANIPLEGMCPDLTRKPDAIVSYFPLSGRQEAAEASIVYSIPERLDAKVNNRKFGTLI